MGCVSFLTAVMAGAWAFADPEEEGKLGFSALGLSVRKWSVDDGLPRERIEAIAQTPDGYLWLGTSEGLAQFNGSQFRVFHPDNNPLMQHYNFGDLKVDGEGTLWIDNAKHHLYSYRDGKFRDVYAGEEGAKSFGSLGGGEARGVLLVRRNQGIVICVTDGEEERPLSEPNRELEGVLAVERSADGLLWVVSGKHRLYRLRERKWERESLPTPNGEETTVGTLFRFRDGALGCVDRSGVYGYANGSWEARIRFSKAFPTPVHAHSSCEDADGNVWFSRGDGQLWIVTPVGMVRKVDTGREGFSAVWRVYSDREGSVWMCASRGLIQARYTPFVTCANPNEILPPWVESIAQDGEGTMWFGCLGSVSYVRPGEMELVVARETERAQGLVAGHSGRGAWYAKQGGGVSLYGRETVENFGLPNWPRGVGFRYLGVVGGREGDLWVGTTRGLYHLDPSRAGGVYERIVLPPEAERAKPNVLGRDREGRLYLGSADSQIYRRNVETGGWDLLTPENVRPAHAYDLTFDLDGRLWTISKKGPYVGCYADGEVLFGETDGTDLEGAFLSGIVADDIGGLWVASPSRGVAHVMADDLYAFLSGASVDLEVAWFDRRQGLATSACSEIRSGICKSRDGRIWVATVAGVSVIDPKKWKRGQAAFRAPTIRIEQCRADGDDLFPGIASGVNPAQTMTVPARTDRVEIRFVSTDYGAPYITGYQYRLRGAEDEWTDTGGAESVSFRNLAPGSYLFEVATYGSGGRYPSSNATLAFQVAPSWWQRLDVRIAFALAGLALLFLIYRFRVAVFHRRQRVQETFSRRLIDSQEEERKRIAGEIHDGLGQHLFLIRNSTEQASCLLEEGSPVRKRLQEATGTVLEAISDVRGITAHLRPPGLDRLGLRVATESMVEKVAGSAGIGFDYNLIGLDQDWGEGEQIAIYRLFQEGLNNVLRHAEATDVFVEAIAEPPMLHILIQDDGKGFDPSAVKEHDDRLGIGLSGMRERANLLGGRLKVDSVVGTGTRLEIDILLPGREKDPRP